MKTLEQTTSSIEKSRCELLLSSEDFSEVAESVIFKIKNIYAGKLINFADFLNESSLKEEIEKHLGIFIRKEFLGLNTNFELHLLENHIYQIRLKVLELLAKDYTGKEILKILSQQNSAEKEFCS